MLKIKTKISKGARLKLQFPRFQNLQLAVERESSKHGPPPWTGSMDRVHQNMDRVHGPPIMDQAHGPPIFTSAKNSSNQRL